MPPTKTCPSSPSPASSSLGCGRAATACESQRPIPEAFAESRKLLSELGALMASLTSRLEPALSPPEPPTPERVIDLPDMPGLLAELHNTNTELVAMVRWANSMNERLLF